MTQVGTKGWNEGLERRLEGQRDKEVQHEIPVRPPLVLREGGEEGGGGHWCVRRREGDEEGGGGHWCVRRREGDRELKRKESENDTKKGSWRRKDGRTKKEGRSGGEGGGT